MYQDMLTCVRINQDHFTLGSVLVVCTDRETLQQGKEVHSHFISRFESGVIMRSALINMYEKCGDVEDSLKDFEKMLERNVVS